eukprot:m.173868 g.173868  ORF g.173868 m.173868 type:complete len:115 (-) comp31743_c0_seq25:341-685(-)
MSDYFGNSAHFWEYCTDSHSVKTWERYDPTVQELIFNKLKHNRKRALLQIYDTDIEIHFDHVTGNGHHRHRDVKMGSDCAVRETSEVVVESWDAFNEKRQRDHKDQLQERRYDY